MFNVGVETGQIIFVLSVSLLLAGLSRLHGHTALTLVRARHMQLAESQRSGPSIVSVRFYRA
jgi:hypothetical protein